MKIALCLLAAATVVSAFAKTSLNQRFHHGSTKTNLRDFRLHESVALSADAAPVKKGGESSVATSTFNLAKSIIGAGILSLPSGVAFFSDQPSALMPAGIIATLFGLTAGYTFSSIGRILEEYKTTSFQECWEKVVDKKTGPLVSAAISTMCFMASLAFSIIISDSFTSLFKSFGLPAMFCVRNNVLLFFSLFVLYPLCSLKSLSALAPFSLLGLSGTLYTAGFMLARLMDKSYAPGGKFFESIVLKPVFSTKGPWKFSQKMSVLLSMLSTSFIAHYNAAGIYEELKDNTMARFNQVVLGAFGAATSITVLVMAVGFATFGGASSGLILNNYANSDLFASLARLAIGVAIVTGYPFAFSAVRDGILDIKGLKGEVREKTKGSLTVPILGLITSLALVLKDVGFVVSMSGALLGCPLMFIVPAIMTLKRLKSKPVTTTGGKVEVAVNYGLIGLGGVMTFLGVFISVMRELGRM